MDAIETLKFLLDKSLAETPPESRLVGLNVPVEIVQEIIDGQSEHDCDTCRYRELSWGNEPCDSCTNANHYKPAQPEKRTDKRTETHACDSVNRQAAIDARRYTFGNDEFSLEAAYHDCKLVFDGITDDDSFQEADTGLILYYANEIIYALQEALEGKDTNVPSDCISRQAAIDIVVFECGKWTGLAKEISKQIKRLPPAQSEQCWETCFDCPLSHGCPKIKGCTNEQAEQYAGEIPIDCPLDKESAQPDVSEVLSILDAIRIGDRIKYRDYCELYDAILEVGKQE